MGRKWKQKWASLLMIAMLVLMVACGEKASDELQEDVSDDLQESVDSTISNQQTIPSADEAIGDDSIVEQTNPVSLYKTISKYSSDGMLQKVIECTYDDSELTLSCDVLGSGERYIFSYDVFGRAIDGKVFSGNEVLIEWESFGKDGNEMIHMEYNGDGTIYMGYQYQYNESGNKIKSIIYASDGSYESEDYDENGNEIKTTNYGSDGSIENFVFYDYEYDSDGNIIVKNTTSSYGWTNKDEYEYDENGNIIKETTYDTDGIAYRWYEYEYDCNGNKVRGSKYEKYIGEDFSRLTYTYTWEYDSEGNMLRHVEYWQDGSVKFEEEYNSKGQCIKELHYADDGSFLSGYECKCDADGRVIQTLFYNDGEISFERTYDYGSNGEVELMRFKDAVEGELYRTEYEYDIEGNMLRSSTYDNMGNAVIIDYQTVFFEIDEENLQPGNLLVLYVELAALDAPVK